MADKNIIDTAVFLFRVFARGVAGRDVQDRRMSQASADTWVEHATNEFRKNLEEIK